MPLVWDHHPISCETITSVATHMSKGASNKQKQKESFQRKQHPAHHDCRDADEWLHDGADTKRTMLKGVVIEMGINS